MGNIITTGSSLFLSTTTLSPTETSTVTITSTPAKMIRPATDRPQRIGCLMGSDPGKKEVWARVGTKRVLGLRAARGRAAPARNKSTRESTMKKLVLEQLSTREPQIKSLALIQRKILKHRGCLDVVYLQRSLGLTAREALVALDNFVKQVQFPEKDLFRVYVLVIGDRRSVQATRPDEVVPVKVWDGAALFLTAFLTCYLRLRSTNHADPRRSCLNTERSRHPQKLEIASWLKALRLKQTMLCPSYDVVLEGDIEKILQKNARQGMVSKVFIHGVSHVDVPSSGCIEQMSQMGWELKKWFPSSFVSLFFYATPEASFICVSLYPSFVSIIYGSLFLKCGLTLYLSSASALHRDSTIFSLQCFIHHGGYKTYRTNAQARSQWRTTREHIYTGQG